MASRLGVAIALMLCAGFTGGCALVLLGAGAGAGTAVYLQGRVVRTYAAEYHGAVRACREALESLKIPVTDETADELKTSLSARRPDGTPVRVEITRSGPGRTEVGVRTGPVGVTETAVSETIQARIGERLAVRAQEIPKSRDGEAPSPTPPPEEAEGRPRTAPGPEAAPRKAAAGPGKTLGRRPSPEFTILFEEGSNGLRPAELAKLDKLVAALAGRPELRLTLKGYPDPQGQEALRRALAESRAASVKMYLVGKGIDPARLQVSGPEPGNEAGEGRGGCRCVEAYLDVK
jgi:outer membrane protein OmpA-like peptidoglycan-associated protein